MRLKWIGGILPISLLFLFSIAYAQTIIPANYTVSQANATIANATQYISTVNESAYLIFYPNLTKAYNYLNMSQQVYTKNPTLAVLYANQATNSAATEYSRISAYKKDALIVIALLTTITAIALYWFGRPIKTRPGSRKN